MQPVGHTCTALRAALKKEDGSLHAKSEPEKNKLIRSEMRRIRRNIHSVTQHGGSDHASHIRQLLEITYTEIHHLWTPHRERLGFGVFIKKKRHMELPDQS